MCRMYWMMAPSVREASRRKQWKRGARRCSCRKPFKHKGHDPARYAERFERFERDEVLKVKTFVPFVSFVCLENAHTYSTSFQGECDCGRQGRFSDREGPCRFAW